MYLVNETSFPAVLQTADFGTDLRFAVVVWKLTFRILPGGHLEPSDEPVPVTGDPLETEYGMFHGDLFLRKQGADLCMLGTIRRSRPVTQTIVTVRCGSFSHSLRVTGDRAWIPTRALDTLSPSAPQPFTTMSLGFSRAFGGTAEYEGMQTACPENPQGRGYALTVEDARGKALPNLEAATGPFVEHWQDTPRPVAWGPYPMHWALRARAHVKIDPEQMIVSEIDPGIFNNAHPDLVLPSIEPGTKLQLVGVTDMPWEAFLPNVRGTVRVYLGGIEHEVPTRIDGVYVWLDAGHIVVTHRANFRYVAKSMEVRHATLKAVS